MYPKFSGVASTMASAASTSSGVAASASRSTTSTPSIRSSPAPATNARTSAAVPPVWEWLTTSRRFGSTRPAWCARSVAANRYGPPDERGGAHGDSEHDDANEDGRPEGGGAPRRGGR